MIHYAIYDSPGGQLLADYTHKARGVRISTNSRGYADCAAQIPLSLPEAFIWYDRPGLPHVELTDNGLTVWEGRLEDPAIIGAGLGAAALGYSRALQDIPYTALWSLTMVDDFRPVLATEIATAVPDRFVFDTQNRVYIAQKKNEVFGTTGAAKQAYIAYLAPDQSSRTIIGVSFDFTIVTPAANWRAGFIAQNSDFSTNSIPWLVNSGGAGTVTGSINTTFTGVPIVSFFMDLNAANATYLGETGANFLRITNLRLVTSTTNRINTTLTANRNAGASVTATVGSTARMYVGQRLQIVGGGGSESVLVEGVTNATQFVATFVNNYVIGDAVLAHVVYADEIAKDIVAGVAAVNSTQLSSNATLIQSPGVDLLDEVYEDQYGADVLDYLASRGDTSLRRWEWAVWDDRRLTFQPHGSGRTWYVDITDLEVIRTLENLANSVYATYQDPTGRILRSATNADSFSVSKYGLTRRQVAPASTTLVAQARIHRDTILADQKDPLPQARIAFDAVYDATGGKHLLAEVRAGDIFVIRNLPPTLSSSIDRIRTFRLTRTDYDLDTGVLTVEPEAPLPTLEAQLATTIQEPS